MEDGIVRQLLIIKMKALKNVVGVEMYLIIKLLSYEGIQWTESFYFITQFTTIYSIQYNVMKNLVVCRLFNFEFRAS